MTAITGPRIGPQTTATGELAIWGRQIRGTHWLFWAWPDRIHVYRVPDHNSPQLVHTYRKES